MATTLEALEALEVPVRHASLPVVSPPFAGGTWLAGDGPALLGDSGNTTGAHLHFQVTDRNSVLQSQGVPFVLSSFTYLDAGATCEPDKHMSERQANSMPPGKRSAAVRFWQAVCSAERKSRPGATSLRRQRSEAPGGTPGLAEGVIPHRNRGAA